MKRFAKTGAIAAVIALASSPTVANAQKWGESGRWRIFRAGNSGCNMIASLSTMTERRSVLIGIIPKRKEPVTLHVEIEAGVTDQVGWHDGKITFGATPGEAITGRILIRGASSTVDGFYKTFSFYTDEKALEFIQRHQRMQIDMPSLGISRNVDLSEAREAIPRLEACIAELR